MGSRGLYPSISVGKEADEIRMMMNFLSYCDGKNSLLDIAEKLSVSAASLYDIADRLIEKDLIGSIIRR